MKKTIWSNYNLDIKDWKDFLEECYPEVDEEDRQYDLIRNMNHEYLQDERLNLNIDCNEIIAIADIGRWNGRFAGYKLCGNNVSEILYSDCDFAEWFCDRYNVKAKMSHHDGTNYILYRQWKDGISDEQKENFLFSIYNGNCTNRKISYYTKSIRPLVAKVYGW